MEIMAKYYLLDTGSKMTSFAIALDKHLRDGGDHVVLYLTDTDGLLCLEEITEDEFLDHYSNKKTNENGKA
jgi:hypothetical protein